MWEWTQTHCIVDGTVGIDCFHCGQHCSALGGVPLLCFWLKIAAGGVVAAGGVAFSTKNCWVWLGS